jgi:excisionase family DNA binding protein
MRLKMVEYTKPERLFSVRKVAKMLDVTTYTVRKWAKEKKINAVKIPDDSPKSQWFISESEVERLRGAAK